MKKNPNNENNPGGRAGHGKKQSTVASDWIVVEEGKKLENGNKKREGRKRQRDEGESERRQIQEKQ